jgi:hypothetical protein
MAILLFNFDRRAFTAETYQRAFAREDFYNKLPNMMAGAIASPGTDKSGLPLVMQGMGVEAWENFLRALLPPDVLKTMGDHALTSIFAYLNLLTDSASVSLTPVKTAMTSDTGTQAVIALIETLPACTVEQMAQITFALFSSGEIQLCNPPDEVMPLLTRIVQGQLQLAASILPDELTLITAPLENDPRLRLQAVRFFLRLSPILPIFFLLTLTVLCVRALDDWLTWWGIPLLITGGFAFIMGLLGAPIMGRIIVFTLENRLPNYVPDFLSNFTSDLAFAMVRALLVPVVWQGLVLLLLGGAMTGFAYYLNKKGVVDEK